MIEYTRYGRYCPIIVAGGDMHLNGECIRKDCAWFLPFANDCAIHTIAGMFADSTICQNVFDSNEVTDDE